MKKNTKTLIMLGIGTFVGSAQYHLTNPKAYAIAAAAGVGAAMASKSTRQGIESGAFAMLGIIGYTMIDSVDDVYEQAVKDGVFED